MCLKERKRALDEELKFYEELGLSVMFVPLCAPQGGLKRNPTCPTCGLVLIDDGDGFVCLECGYELLQRI
jgi:ribosomal protein S27AE